MFCIYLVLSAELISELGLDSSDHCDPIRKVGPVISAESSSQRVTDAEIAASSLFLQSVSFLDGDLQSITDGFPREVNKSVCLKCLESDRSKLKILSGCSVSHERVYSPGEVYVGSFTPETDFGTITIGFNETKKGGVSYLGSGDLTDNGRHCSMFSFNTVSSPESQHLELFYFEYSLSRHCREMRARSENSDSVVWDRSKGTVWKTRIACTHSTIEASDLQMTLQIYRSMQLESTILATYFSEDENRFKPLSDDDVYRAALSLKLSDDMTETGSFSVYTDCGKYDFWYMTPLFVLVALIIILRTVSWYIVEHGRDLSNVYVTGSWYYEAVRSQMALRKLSQIQNQDESEEYQSERRLWKFNSFKYAKDELVLIGDGDNVCVRIEFQDDAMNQMFMDVGAGPSSSVHDVSCTMDEFQRKEEEIVARNNRFQSVIITAPVATFDDDLKKNTSDVGAPDSIVPKKGTVLSQLFQLSGTPKSSWRK